MTVKKKASKKKIVKRTVVKKKIARRPVAKKKTARRTAVKMGTSKRIVARRKVSAVLGPKTIVNPPTGYGITDGGFFLPESMLKPVPASKMSDGLSKARKKMIRVMSEFASSLAGDYSISEIEFTASFDAEGKFLGFGFGGAASIKITIKPAGVQ